MRWRPIGVESIESGRNVSISFPLVSNATQPVFANLPAAKLKRALRLAQELMGDAGQARLDDLAEKSAKLRAI